MSDEQASTLRKAIENLMNAKLYDLMARPGGLERLVAHRMTGVASHDVRNAEQQLERTIAELLPEPSASAREDDGPVRSNRRSHSQVAAVV